MNPDNASLYINALYASKGLHQDVYGAATGLEDYGMPVDDDVSRMLTLLVRMTRPQKILEIGTSIGFSTASMAQAVVTYGGQILTIEYDPAVAQAARDSFARHGFAENIEVVVADAQEYVPSLEGSFDMIFQDVGDKTLYETLFDDCVRLLKPGGLFVIEDTLFPVMHDEEEEGEGGEDEGEEEGEGDDDWDRQGELDSIDRFNGLVANCPLFESTLLSIGDGLTIAFKLSDA
jgi:predicted O-methyltransferase YrrM